MCNACGFLCCGSDRLYECGCNSCQFSECHERCPHCRFAPDDCICDPDYDPDDDEQRQEG